jgi:glycosyltransferase involved in cell wall biosynthesis
MTGDGRVGIVLPVKDGGEYVGSAIESVLAQTYDDFELVVVDDGSTDGTPEVVRGFDDPRVTLVENERNLGVGASRNRGADRVGGELLAHIDHDDVWQPSKLQRHVAAHRATGADLVYSDVREVAADGTVLRERTLPDPQPAGPPLVRQLLFGGGAVVVTMSCVTIRRATWTSVGGEAHDYQVSGDVDLYVRLAGSHAFARVPEPLVDKRSHGGNISDDYRTIYRNHQRILSRALARYPFLDGTDEQHKRARMAYRRATSALRVGRADEAARYGRESLAHERRLRPALVAGLAALDRLAGPFDPGHRLYRAYDRWATRTGGG